MRRLPLLLAPLLALSSQGLRLLEGGPHSKLQQRLRRYHGKGTNEVTNPFQNVLLVVHCRLRTIADKQEAATVCEERRPLFDGYTKHFGQVLYLTHKECGLHPSDVHKCVGELMETEGRERDGIFYMHFNAMISAQHLRSSFDKEMMAAYGEDFRCRLNEKMRLRNCSWTNWSPSQAERYKQAIEVIAKENKEFSRANMHVYFGSDDIFYIPHKLYRLYKNLTTPFIKHHVRHDIVGPTVRKLLEKTTNVFDLSLNCGGACCESLKPTVVLSPNYQCGHHWDFHNSSYTAPDDGMELTISLRTGEDEDYKTEEQVNMSELRRFAAVLTE